MNRVVEKRNALPVASGMDRHAQRLFALAAKQTVDALQFGAERLVRWLNGWETVADFLHHRGHDQEPGEYKLWLKREGGDPKKRIPLEIDQWTEGSRDRVLNLLVRLKGEHARVLGVAAEYRQRFGEELNDRRSVVELKDIDRMLEQYAVVPKVLLKPATGEIAVGYRTKHAYYASFGMSFAEFEAMERELAEWPPEPEPPPEMLALQAKLKDAQGPPYAEVQAAHAILDLARFGVLDLVRQCYCGNWLFAAKKHYVNCSEKCRHRKYERDPAFRERRREYARGLYQQRKNGIGEDARERSRQRKSADEASSKKRKSAVKNVSARGLASKPRT